MIDDWRFIDDWMIGDWGIRLRHRVIADCGIRMGGWSLNAPIPNRRMPQSSIIQ
jgi:hypothetical protein